MGNMSKLRNSGMDFGSRMSSFEVLESETY